MKKFSVVILIALFLAASHNQVFANHREKVLGASTAQLPSLPATAEGPGLLLPDSPFFVLDELKQEARLFFAFTPEAKARTYTAIAGERTAELRFMLAKNNTHGIDVDLEGITENMHKAADAIAQIQLTGRNVTALAKQTNDNIKQKQELFDVLAASNNLTIQLKAKAVQEELLAAKVTVEDALPDDELAKAVEDDLQRTITWEVEAVSPSADRIERQLAVLGDQASSSAKDALKRREEALRQAKNKTEQDKAIADLEGEKKKQDALFKAQDQALGEAKKAIENAQKASASLQLILQNKNTLKNKPVSSNFQVSTSSGQNK